MTWSFQLTSEPSDYRRLSFPSDRNGIFYEGGIPVVTLASAAPASTTYEVRDYEGTVVSSGAVGTGVTAVTPTAPGGGWPLGWYRFYLYGPNDDAVYGHSRGATSFAVIRDDPHFPPMPPDSNTDGRGGYRDLIGKGVLGIGTSRLGVYDTGRLTTAPGDRLSEAVTDLPFATAYWSNPSAPYADSARPRPLWTNIDLTSVDSVELSRAGDSFPIGNIYRAAAAAPTSAGPYVTVTPGTNTGWKLQVRDTSGGAVVETYDDLPVPAQARDLVNVSTRVHLESRFNDEVKTDVLTSPTPIGRARWDGMVEVVTTLWPDVQHYEGPSNEPRLDRQAAHEMKIFAAAVHAGNPAAKAMGPCPVELSGLPAWREFFAAGGGDACDLLAFHDYNSMTNGCLPQGRGHIERFLAMLVEEGYDHLPMWQTEAGAAFTAVYGVHHPRRARVSLLHTLLWEQYGIPRERNTYWYDTSHGFWDYPTWWANEDRSVTPEAPLYRVLAEETWGRPHTGSLTFGFHGDRIFLGSVYTDSGGDAVHVLMATSVLPDASVTYTVTGATALDVVDHWGNVTSTAVTDGLLTVPVRELPSYLRVPDGVEVTVHHCNDWPPTADLGAWVSASPRAVGTIDGSSRSALGDDAWPYVYGDGSGLAAAAAPIDGSSAAVLEWETGTYLDRVILWAAYGWQPWCTPLAFTIEVTADGDTWVEVADVDVSSTAASFKHGTGTSNTGCQRETYWDEQWVHDVKLDAPVMAKAVRVVVTEASYGGEPDAASVAAGGQGTSTPTAGFMEVAVLSDENTQPSHVVLPPPPFDPATISSLVAWFRADDLDPDLDGQPVNLWPDAKGSNDGLAGPGVANPPVLDLAGLNGNAAVVYATDKAIKIPQALVSSKPWSFAVLFLVDDITHDYYLVRNSGTGANVRTLNGALMDLVMPGVAQIGVSTETIGDAAPQVAVFTYSNTGGWTIRINGELAGSGTNNQTWGPGNESFLGYQFSGAIREALFFDGVLSADDAVKLSAYLADQGD